MTFRQLAFVPMATALIVLLAACGNQSSTPPAITVTFPPAGQPFAPPTSMSAGSSAGIAATINNGPQNAVVNWSCIPTSQCGGFAPTSTASGVPTMYTAPTNVPPGGTVTITATSATNPPVSASATIMIN